MLQESSKALNQGTSGALVLHGIGDLRFEKVTIPLPEKDEVLVKVRASGICGSDVARVFTKGTYTFPLIPGHEFAGEIVRTGEGVDHAWVGRRVAVFPLLPCFQCPSCVREEYATCTAYDYYGSRRDGGFTEYQAIKVWNLVFIPDNLSYEEAAMAEPAAVARHALLRGAIRPGDRVAIAGAGPIGLMLGLWAKYYGAAAVILWDIDDAKVAFARSMGFEEAFSSLEAEPAERVLQRTGGQGADLAVEGAGAEITLNQCIRCLGPGGRLVTMGNPLGDMHLPQKVYWEILRKQLTVTGTWNSSYTATEDNDWTAALEAMSSGRLPVKPFVTHRFRFEEGNAAFAMVRERTSFYNKVLFVNE